MLGSVEVFGCVLILRRIAASDMAARHAQAQMNRGVTQDFFREVRRILADRGIPETVVKVEEERK